MGTIITPTQVTMRFTSLRSGEFTNVNRRASSASFAA